MYKFVILILVFATAVLAVRPHWYPANDDEIQAKCMEKHSISPEVMADLRKLKLPDTPAMRSFILCITTGKNVFRPVQGFEAERFDLAAKHEAKVQCNMDTIRECAEKHRELQPDEAMYFTTFTCIINNAKCSPIA